MDIYSQIAVKIIAGQEAIIGPVAVEQAEQVEEMKLNWQNQEVTISGDKISAIDELIDRYKELFGQVSVEVSKQAAAPLIAQLSDNELPQTLK